MTTTSKLTAEALAAITALGTEERAKGISNTATVGSILKRSGSKLTVMDLDAADLKALNAAYDAGLAAF